MAEWVLVAEGNSLDNVTALVGNFQLPKGSKLRYEMELNMPVAWAFDLAGVEHLFSAPEGMRIVDVHGRGWSTAVIDMEADPAWLVAVLAFVGRHWLAITIAGFVLAAIIIAVKVWGWIEKAAPTAINVLLIGSAVVFVGALGVVLITLAKPKTKPGEQPKEGP